MKTLIVLVTVGLFAVLSAAAATNTASLVEIKSSDYGDTNSLMRVVELERNANTSTFRLTYEKRGTSVGSSMFTMYALYKVAQARGTEYFTNLKEWSDKKGGRFYIGGFTNNKDADIQAEFGEQYAPVRKDGKRRSYVSV